MIKDKKILSPAVLSVILIMLLAACSPATPTKVAEPAANQEAAAIPTTVVVTDQSPAAPTNTVAGAELSKMTAAQNGTLESIYKNVGPSVVHIEVIQNAAGLTGGLPSIPGFPGLPGPGETPQARGEGSGFVWSADGYIVTNNHVIENAEKITVVFADDTRVPATVVGADPNSDLAVLKVDVPASELKPVTLGDSTSLQVGQLAIAIGNPFGQEGTMTVGIVSALGRLLPVNTESSMGGPHYDIPDVIQTDASINPGNSGGVLLNDQGEVIGVTSAIISPAQVSSGVGFAIPSAIVQQVVPVLISQGHYEHPYLGISGTTLTPELATAMDLPADQRGALIGEVTPDGPAGQAGLMGSTNEVQIDGEPVLAGGDVITAIDGQPIESMDDLIAYLARSTKVGQTVDLTVLRDGNQQSISVTLEARPEATPAPVQQASAQNNEGRPWLGIVGATVTPEIAQAMDLPADQAGVLIAEVTANSPASEAGLQGGNSSVTLNGNPVTIGGDVIISVDGQTIQNMEQLVGILSQHQPGDSIVLQILRDGSTMQIDLTLGEWPG
ncbi:MAG: trypsin-like peptidase domain-containing protein [Candidatus Promineifilaceae bacterium]